MIGEVNDELIIIKDIKHRGDVYIKGGSKVTILEIYTNGYLVDYFNKTRILLNTDENLIMNVREFRDDKLKELLDE